MTEAEAYKAYQEYTQKHVPTKADPLRTFSGWLMQNLILLTDEGP